MTQQPSLTDHRDSRRGGTRARRAVGSIQALHLRVAVIPAAVMALLSMTVVGCLLVARPSPSATRVVLACALVAAVAVLAGAAYGAMAATRRMHDQVGALRMQGSRSREELQRLAERVQRGERPVLADTEPAQVGEADPFSLLRNDLAWQQRVAEQAVLKAAGLLSASGADQRVEVFVNLAWRMQSLVHREIQLLDDLEAQVEDPELLKGLFTVDHLATRMRRQSESLAVLGGAVSRRQWTRPVTMHEVLRAAVAEVEQYSRVKVVPPVDGILQGSAVADVIHLIAELVENATKFSAPHTQALLRAQHVTAGIAVEVEDRGLGMLAADRNRMNGLLADPGLVNIGELLRDGRIGLFVVSSLARRHGINVQLQGNIFGGTQAVVVLPHKLIEAGPAERGVQPAVAAPAGAAGLPAPATGPAPVPAHAPAITHAPAPGLPGGGQYVISGGLHEPAAAGTEGPADLAAEAPPADGGSGPWLQPRIPAPSADGGSGPWPQLRIPAPSADGGSGPWPALPSAGHLVQPAADQGARPPLPQRQAQANLAPQLRETAGTRRDHPPADQIPGLMAAFQRGFSRAEEEGSTAGD